MLLDELATLSATRVPSPGVIGRLKWMLLRPWRRTLSGNLAETAHALRRYITEIENDRAVTSDSYDVVQETQRQLYESLSGIQVDYDNFKVSIASSIAALERDGSGIRDHLSALQTDSDLQKSHLSALQTDSDLQKSHLSALQADSDLHKIQTGETAAAMQKDAETLRDHLANLQEDVDRNKKVSGDTIAALQKDAEMLRDQLSGILGDSIASLQSDAEALRQHVAGLQNDHDRVSGMAAELMEAVGRLTQLAADLHLELTTVAEAVSHSDSKPGGAP